MRVFLILFVVFLSGCFLDQKGKINQENSPPVIHLPPNQEVDTEKLRSGIKEDTRQEVMATSTSTAAQMTGAVNASVSKLADKLTGLEANIKAVMENTVNMNVQASAELRAKLEASLTAVTELRAEFKMINEFNTKLESKIALDANLIKDLDAKIGQLNAQLTAQMTGMANGQVGALNKIESKLETITNTAGRDVNQMPKETVEVMLGSYRMLMYIIGGVLSAITTIAGYAYRNARKREEQQAQILLKALAQLQPDTAKDLADEHAATRSQL